MNNCPYCGQPAEDAGVHNSAFDLGATYPVAASIYAPAWQILRGNKTQVPPDDPLASMKKLIDQHKSLRPCIKMESPDDNLVTLMTTFCGKPVTELPRIFQHFCIPVFPNLGVIAHGTHIHSTPQWPDKHQWVIGYRLTLAHAVHRDTRWQCVETGEQTYGFGPYAMALLMYHCDEKNEEWILQGLVDPSFYQEQEAEIKVRTWIPIILALAVTDDSSGSYRSAQEQEIPS